MGSFSGHLLPGLFFVVFGLRWTYAIFSEYYYLMAKHKRVKSEKDNQEKGNNNYSKNGLSATRFQCRCFFPVFGCETFEAWFTVISAVVGVFGEFVTAFKGGKFTHIGNIQHMLMYLAFGLWGLSFLMSSHEMSREKPLRRKLCQFLPPGIEYFTLMMSLFIEGSLFYYHLHGRSPLDVHVHQLLILCIFLSLIAVVTETLHRHEVLSAVFRAYASLLQGSWFIQVCFIAVIL